jgi:hypothetical protein
MVAEPDYTWRLAPRSTPRVRRHCPRCEEKRDFVSSDKFRVNGHQNRVDVWLIYKCPSCDFTWNATIFTRIMPKSISSELYDAFMRNDRETAWRYAFDYPLLRKLGVEVDTHFEYAIAGEPLDPAKCEAGEVTIAIEPQFPTQLRIEQLLSQVLGLSRSAFKRLVEERGIAIEPPEEDDFSRKLKRPIRVRLDRARLRRTQDE